MALPRSLARAAIAGTTIALALFACSGARPVTSPPPAAPQVSSPTPATAAPPTATRRRHVILVIGDGMSRASEIAASRFLSGTDEALAWHGADFEFRGFASTWDVTTYDRHAQALRLPRWTRGSFVPSVGYDVLRGGLTPLPPAPPGNDEYLVARIPLGEGPARVPAADSASTATAMATGAKTDEGNVAWAPGDPYRGRLVTIAEHARERLGAAVGIVTTVPFSHATPASFVAHSPTREAYEDIARQIVRWGPEVVIGGGHPQTSKRERPFEPERWMGPGEYAALKDPESGWVLVERTRSPGGRALLRAASRLPRGGRLFGLFGGKDGAFEPPVPATDGSGVVRPGGTQDPSLADAATAALTVLARDPEGFFLLVEQGDIDWANHARDYGWMVGAVWDLDQAVRAITGFVDRPGDALTWKNTLLVVTSDHANGHLRLGPSRGKGVLPAGGDGSFTWGEPATGAPVGHTNELVTLAARGAGARALFSEVEGRWYPGTRIVDNTQIHEVMMRAMGLDDAPPPMAAWRR